MSYANLKKSRFYYDKIGFFGLIFLAKNIPIEEEKIVMMKT